MRGLVAGIHGQRGPFHGGAAVGIDLLGSKGRMRGKRDCITGTVAGDIMLIFVEETNGGLAKHAQQLCLNNRESYGGDIITITYYYDRMAAQMQLLSLHEEVVVITEGDVACLEAGYTLPFTIASTLIVYRED